MRATRHLSLAALLFPCTSFPAAAQVRSVPVELPATVSVTPQAAPNQALATGLARAQAPLSSPLNLASSLIVVNAALPAAAQAAAARPSARPVARATAKAASNRFWSAGLGRVLDELAAWAGPSVAPVDLAAGRAAQEDGERRPAFQQPHRGPAQRGYRPARPAARPAPSAPERPRIPAPGSGAIQDAWLYSRIYASSLYWYTFPRLVERWVELRDKLREAAGRPRAVSDIRGFFIAHRVLGSTGNYSPLGFRVASNRIVAKDALDIYDRYFAKDPRAKRAFTRMIQRAQSFNPHRRSTQFRKALFHALREASVLPPDEVAAFFDRQLDPEKAAVLERYQRETQPKVLAAFDEAVNEVISGMNRDLPPGERVVGALLLGSYANGAAGPGSDLDVQAIAEGGSHRYNNEFILRLKARWKPEEAWSASPVSTFQYALPLSKRLVGRVHREPYLIYTPYPEVREALTRTPEEETADAPSTIRTIRGWAFQQSYSALLRAVLAGYEVGEYLRLIRR